MCSDFLIIFFYNRWWRGDLVQLHPRVVVGFKICTLVEFPMLRCWRVSILKRTNWIFKKFVRSWFNFVKMFYFAICIGASPLSSKAPPFKFSTPIELNATERKNRSTCHDSFIHLNFIFFPSSLSFRSGLRILPLFFFLFSGSKQLFFKKNASICIFNTSC